MSIRERIEQALSGLALRDARLEFGGEAPGETTVCVIAPGFREMSEADRQELVWNQLISALDEAEIVDIDFVFTLTPEEWDNAA